ncbi:MAG: Hsp20/alpha crystallin family protein [Deltaproteobacteria bacterium]|nr:Hsp20/alpha crystallin family protein [Deltaproteobacteria bacterium]
MSDLITNTEKENEIQKAKKIMPAVDIYEGSDSIVMVLDMPGVEEKNIDLQFEKREIHIYGKVSLPDERWKYQMNEYGYPDYERSFRLPGGLEVSKTSAHFEDGVLSITIPKHPEEKPFKISIQ